MSIKLNSEQQQMVLDNRVLVNLKIRQLGINPNVAEYEDLVSIGTIGLIKAALTFDSSKHNTFSTYACRCISNEIFMYYRKAKKYANNISLYSPISNNDEGNQMTLLDKIEHTESNFEENIITKEYFLQLISIILNYLTSSQRLVILYLMGDISESEIGKILDVSQSYVSRIKKRAILEIRKAVNRQICYEEVFSVEIVQDTYKITFSLKDISNFNIDFSSLLQNLVSISILHNFNLSCNNGQIIIHIPAHPESFYFVAQIIQEIDNYRIRSSSNKNT